MMYLPADGNEKLSFTLGGEGQDFAYDLLVQNKGSVWLTGQSFSKNPPFEKNKGKGDILWPDGNE